jgi:kynurenine formamidase
LRTGTVFVECLTGLERIPPRGAWFCFLPIKIEGGTGAPGRAVAILAKVVANRGDLGQNSVPLD